MPELRAESGVFAVTFRLGSLGFVIGLGWIPHLRSLTGRRRG